jgi:hypothetical protein
MNLIVACSNASICIQVCGGSSIQEAVDTANPGDTIIVSDGTYTENVKIDKSLNIKGSGPETIVDGNRLGPVFTIGKTDPNVKVVLSGLNIVNGKSSAGGGGVINNGTTTIEDSILSRNSAFEDGGAVINYGRLTVIGSDISLNTALGNGGGISNYGKAEVKESIVSKNMAACCGGGIANKNIITVINSNVSENRANAIIGGVGGIFNGESGRATIVGCSIVANTGHDRGGLYNDRFGEINMSDCTVSRNIGNGIMVIGAMILNSTLVNNNRAEFGGGINVGIGGILIMNNVIIIAKQAAAVGLPISAI